MISLVRDELQIEVGREWIRARLHAAPGAIFGVVWVFGAGGGLGGPAGGLYERLGELLQGEGISSLEIDYRKPGVLHACVEDTLAGTGYLRTLGTQRIILVGRSFGGAVVINAGAASRRVIGVAALSSQSYQTEAAAKLSPRPLLLMHGKADEVLPAACSLDIYRRARHPKCLLFYPGCGHGLDECREAIDRDLLLWIRRTVEVTHV